MKKIQQFTLAREDGIVSIKLPMSAEFLSCGVIAETVTLVFWVIVEVGDKTTTEWTFQVCSTGAEPPPQTSHYNKDLARIVDVRKYRGTFILWPHHAVHVFQL